MHDETDARLLLSQSYRNTFRRKYRSPIEKRDSFYITYDELCDQERFESDILPKLWEFLGVKGCVAARRLKETTKQADPTEDLSTVIENYEELEFCFRHSDVLHFAQRREEQSQRNVIEQKRSNSVEIHDSSCLATWSILLPICSRPKISQAEKPHHTSATKDKFNTNRFLDLTLSSQYNDDCMIDEEDCWDLLRDFAASLQAASSKKQLQHTECIVGIDVDDRVFQNDLARKRIQSILPCKVVFVRIQPTLYGQLCKIWNMLAHKASKDFIVLLGDDVTLLDPGWQERIVRKFHLISKSQNLPFGAACVAMKDLSFPGFPTFPVVHRWHIQHFGSLLPKQFANQGGDPYLYELYSRFNAAAFEVSCRLENKIGGDGDARYQKYAIDWRRQILSLNLTKMKGFLNEDKPKGVCLDVIVPSYRVDNDDFLRRIALLRATSDVYVKFWFVVDNPKEEHVKAVKQLAIELNDAQLRVDGNYFINVIHYAENRGASYARNTGYNYTTADWVLFLDDDVIPDENILDAYIGALKRYPQAKVFVGLTELPEACNGWTEMLCACNVGYFYGIAKRMVHPSWGVTANLMVRGSRHNSTIQFKDIYPKTGGGEDIDFVYQFKEWYRHLGRRITVGVPEAKAKHPWWNSGQTCYRQIAGWAWGDSLCISEWGGKTFLAFPNWIEHTTFILPPLAIYTGNLFAGLMAGLSVVLVEHAFKARNYFDDAKIVSGGGLLQSLWVALGAGSVLSVQEMTRTAALVYRGSLYSLCRRVDWFDGEEPRIKLDIQLGSILRFGLNSALTWAFFRRQAKAN